MKTTIIPSRWLGDVGRRLDPGPYLSGAIEAKEVLRLLKVKKERLIDLTKGHAGGIFNGPQFSRNYVDSPDYGVPFLGSSSMLLADLSHVPLLRRKDAESNKLKHLRLEPGMTLISCSGTIGRMVYARPDMAGMWSSQDVMKVAPDPDKIPPGYLYAFLSSRFGVPMVTSSTYGAIIQHIEPEHLRDLPIPLLDKSVMCDIGDLVGRAAILRSRAQAQLREMRELVAIRLQGTGLPASYSYSSPQCGSAGIRRLQKRADAEYYAQIYTDAEDIIKRAGEHFPLQSLGEVADVWNPGIFKRRFVEDKAYGYPYLLAKDVFSVEPKAESYLSRRLAEDLNLVLRKNMILIQDSGQVGGLIGRAVFVGRQLENCSCTNHMIMITPKADEDAGYLFALLSSDLGYRTVVREASGSSIPNLEVGRMRELKLPWPSRQQRLEFHAMVVDVNSNLDEAADLCEKSAALLELALTESI
ncbi:MAG: restriction endonuclease subunit S [Bryobacter sp.]|jgi:type I restriction enzyme S subunit|nr:restriction endonuclease subunit S [Bryobacter sp. CoA8 C33]